MAARVFALQGASTILPVILIILYGASVQAKGLADEAADLLNSIHDAVKGLGPLEDLLSGGNCQFTCANGDSPMQNRNYRPAANGCLVHGKPVFSNGLPGMTECCDAHSQCYAVCKANRTMCDTELGTCMRDVCELEMSVSSDAVNACTATVSLYTATLTLTACTGFKTVQAEACLCRNAVDEL